MLNFNGVTESELDIQQKGYIPLDAKGIASHIVGKTFLGFFPPSFKYIIFIDKDGSLEGENNYQHYDTGNWVINAENNTFNVSWNFGWEKSTNHVYFVNNKIIMFDLDSGKMNTYFDNPIDAVESIKAFDV